MITVKEARDMVLATFDTAIALLESIYSSSGDDNTDALTSHNSVQFAIEDLKHHRTKYERWARGNK